MLKKKLLQSAAVLAIGALALTGCTNKNSTADSGSGDSGKTTVAFVPKLQGIPYFEAMNAGGQQAAEDLGIEWLYQGPTTADAAAQADIVRSLIQQKVDALIVAPNDPDSMAPLLKQAQEAGIKVATADTDAPNSVRQVFVNQTTEENHGKALSESLMKAMGGTGEFAIVSCSETAANLNAYIEVIKKDVAANYPQGKLVDLVYAGEDQAKAAAMATDLMNAHPNLKGIVGLCSAAAPGVAQAVKDAGKIGQVFTVGGGTPMAMAPYLKDGSSSASVLWDVQNLGYLTAWTGKELADDKTLEPAFDVDDKIKGVTFDAESKIELLGPPLVFTKDNVQQFKY
ncbi:sugar ABC transporter substrate-binding protein [Arthrobacter psychrolactophilus]|uniref:Sugar ABC transporter substrate-binding protein n=1 Tax=Arthrobacter psychrolactophilus TaxID=92442 RepID=A0A2V5JMQ0_9MICC|nr:autoinducer 2 ABC transporter substrate-binding protein [Arthrobacter psychrolactophilus]PYI39446.1 sugar ABC transporter substrate-binding protein [Arthrobacter psychrolactophilus]